MNRPYLRHALLLVALGVALAALVDMTKHEEVQHALGAEAGVGGVSDASPAPPTPLPADVGDGPGYIVPPVTWDSLTDEAARGSVREVTVEGAELQPDHALSLAPPSTAPHTLEVQPSLLPAAEVKEPAPNFTPVPALADLAACGVPCWGERLTHVEVEALALRVTGDAAWSSWAGWCFTGPRESGGYVGAVGGPNSNGTYDVGYGQSNTATLAGLGYDAARVLVDVEYAMRALYATWRVQGVGAWYGCASVGGGE